MGGKKALMKTGLDMVEREPVGVGTTEHTQELVVRYVFQKF